MFILFLLFIANSSNAQDNIFNFETGISGFKYFTQGLKYEKDNCEIDYPDMSADDGIPQIYYVSGEGDDGNDGSIINPFRTISAAAGVSGAGDTVFIRGGVYNETVIIPGDGYAGAPIVFMAYPGEKVVITGTDTVSSWDHAENNIYYTEIASEVTQVFYDGVQMINARWPDLKNEDLLLPEYALIDQLIKAPYLDTATLIDSGLNGLPDLSGGKVWMQGAGKWHSISESILSHQGGQIRFINSMSADIISAFYPDNGSLFFVYGKKDLISADKEWYYDIQEGRLYFHAPGGVDPSGASVVVRTRQNGFIIQGDHVHIQGLDFFAAGAEILGDYISIEGCNFYYPCPFFNVMSYTSRAGIHLKGNNNTIKSCEIAYSWGTAITIPYGSAHHQIENCLLHDLNWMGACCGAIDVYGREHYVEKNTIYKTGRDGIFGMNKKCIIVKNHIHGIGYLCWDLGAIYLTSWSDPLGDREGLVITRNYTHQKAYEPDVSHYINGIYLDMVSSNAFIYNNIIESMFTGVAMNGKVHNNKVFNNIMYNTVYQAMYQWEQGNPEYNYVNVGIYNNITNGTNLIGTDKKNNYYKQDFLSFGLAGPEYGDFRPLHGSPVIDAGTEVNAYLDYAIGKPDAGAYEFMVNGEPGNWMAGINWSPEWNTLPVGDIMIEQDSLYPARYTFFVTNDSDAEGWIMRYDWNFGDGTEFYGKSVTHTYSCSGIYTVILTLYDDLGGVSTISKKITVDLLQAVSTLEEQFIAIDTGEGELSLYPNPVSDLLGIELAEPAEILRILDPCGRVFMEYAGMEAGKHSLYVGDLPMGILMVHVWNKGKSTYMLIVKK